MSGVVDEHNQQISIFSLVGYNLRLSITMIQLSKHGRFVCFS